MKRKDIMTIVVVAIFAGIFSLIVSKIFFASGDSRKLTAETVEPISSDFQSPDTEVFNPQAIDPTQLIKIGDTNNPQPF
ncbi:MAG TPA: hypothetical protein VFW77_04640 [Candidatus Saccharimonadales bacterium]|nr:hypothetical protein [Candidatus Saccharimonadales bacterium]